jgi:hypothetical protein
MNEVQRRAIFKSFFLDGKTHKEIAASFGISIDDIGDINAGPYTQASYHVSDDDLKGHVEALKLELKVAECHRGLFEARTLALEGMSNSPCYGENLIKEWDEAVSAVTDFIAQRRKLKAA